ncbi:helix-turn-helix domain-containing protein [Chitinophaga oryziterrae]|uniref:Helix-turn-helix domain-containing protein n=1 Tax=Chitinophaga oryziterrae TaxID=1031224 RepID=A0A6N8JE14_9BACT|nr:AraC family transcriptional regulator [Chitinophaga oryziterrae]MVT42362.1 helix-turn-helix domain-containing protein [Chitinophaga oryziterrae]
METDFNTELKLKGFKAYEVDGNAAGHNYSRKDFYKISLTSGKYNFHYADRSFDTDGPLLFFGNPRIPYACEVIRPTVDGFACLFTEDFLKLNDRTASLLESPLFKIGGTPVFILNDTQTESIKAIFQKIIAEQDSEYAFKDELIRNYIQLIIHEALKMQPSENWSRQKNAAARISAVFFELLERQFPVESADRPLELRTAQDFARNLSVHINYLNSAVKETTGKSTTTHIGDRIIAEAKALLQHTDWNIAEIAYALGFEYPTYFNNFFKKKTGYVPKSVRATRL